MKGISIRKLTNLDTNLTIIANIARSNDITGCQDLVKSLIILLVFAECTFAEMSVFTMVLERMSPHYALIGL